MQKRSECGTLPLENPTVATPVALLTRKEVS